MSEELNKTTSDEDIVSPKNEEKPFKIFTTQKDFDDYNAHIRKSTEEKTLKSVTRKEDNGTEKVDYDKLKAEIIKDYGATIRAEELRKLKMTAEELEKERLENAQKEIDAKNLEYNKKEVLFLLKEAGFAVKDDKDDFTPLAGLVLNSVSTDLDASKSIAHSITETFKKEVSQAVKKEQELKLYGQTQIGAGNNSNKSIDPFDAIAKKYHRK